MNSDNVMNLTESDSLLEFHFVDQNLYFTILQMIFLLICAHRLGTIYHQKYSENVDQNKSIVSDETKLSS